MNVFASPFSIPIVAIGGVFIWMIVQAIVTTVRDIVKHRNEIELKQSLVDRGLSVEEIERVLHATTTDKSRH